MLGLVSDPLMWAIRAGGLELRQGRSRDRLKLNWLWNHAALRHRVPGRESQGELLMRTPNVLWYDAGVLRGALFVSLMRAPVVEVRQVALLAPSDAAVLAESVLPAFAERCRQRGLHWLSVHACEPWLEAVLPRAGFRREAEVVSLAATGWQEYQAPWKPGSCRPSTLMDTDAVCRIDRLAFAPFWRINRALIRECLGSAAYRLVAEVQREAVGYLCAERWPSEAYISRIGVLPEWQGRGIGQALLTEALTRIRADGVDRVVLNTQSDNQRSMRLYAGSGFEPTGDLLIYWSCDLTATQS